MPPAVPVDYRIRGRALMPAATVRSPRRFPLWPHNDARHLADSLPTELQAAGDCRLRYVLAQKPFDFPIQRLREFGASIARAFYGRFEYTPSNRLFGAAIATA
jgi:hypothetical protein